MKKCSDVTVILAHLSFVYVIASVVYLIATSFMGTPFNDSLTSYQKDIKKTEASKRGCIFGSGVFVAILVILMVKPFEKI